MKNKKLIVAALFVNACFLQSCDNTNNKTIKNEIDSSMNHTMPNDSMNSGMMEMDKSLMQSMSSMKSKMKDMKMTGDFDVEFAYMMIMHHQAAIDMSKVEIAKGTDTTIKTIAHNIIIAQTEEINQLEMFVNNYKMPEANRNDTKMHRELKDAMKTMMDKMDLMQMTGNTDMDFVRMMITHHESAVKMAGDEISYGKHSEMKKMAQKMSMDQSKEIANFKAWLSNQK
jgi:uncharacterized protein (DUF305 family)